MGVGFTGLTAGYELSKKGKSSSPEMDKKPGGLAGVFEFEDAFRLRSFTITGSTMTNMFLD